MEKPAPQAYDSPYVDYAHVTPGQKKACWRYSAEDNIHLVLEANRRFMAETGDQRRADLLTLAWASLEGGCE